MRSAGRLSLDRFGLLSVPAAPPSSLRARDDRPERVAPSPSPSPRCARRAGDGPITLTVVSPPLCVPLRLSFRSARVDRVAIWSISPFESPTVLSLTHRCHALNAVPSDLAFSAVGLPQLRVETLYRLLHASGGGERRVLCCKEGSLELLKVALLQSPGSLTESLLDRP